MEKVVVTLAKGDGIGPEITDAVVSILKAANTPIEFDEIEVGLKLYDKGIKTGIETSGWDSLRKTKVFLKGPITTPQGGGMKSLNVTIRTTLGLFANVRPCVALHPYVQTKHPKMDLVIIRENEEDLYTGIEHQQTRNVVQCLKLITVPGSEKIIRYAFEYAKANGRKKVSCFVKDNIMKLTDGLFHKIFNEVALEYPEIENDHYIIDIGTARLADTPERFDVIVTPNLYGDIISDVAAQITGSVGIAGSSNIGDHCAMFEAIHGAAPDIAGKGIANPSGLLLAAVQMLVHLGLNDYASTIQNALYKTFEDGIHTPDIFKDSSKVKATTQEFAKAVIKNLGQKPSILKVTEFPASQNKKIDLKSKHQVAKDKTLIGVDVFIDYDQNKTGEDLASVINSSIDSDLTLQMITNRGVKVWPNGFPETFCTDHWRCRFISSINKTTNSQIISLLTKLNESKLEIIKTENLYLFDGKQGFSSGQE